MLPDHYCFIHWKSIMNITISNLEHFVCGGRGWGWVACSKIVSGSESRGPGFDLHKGCCVVSLNKTHLLHTELEQLFTGA